MCDYNQLSEPQVSSHSHYQDWLMTVQSNMHFVHSARSINLNGNVWLNEWVSTFAQSEPNKPDLLYFSLEISTIMRIIK